MGRLSTGELWDERDWIDLSSQAGVITNPADLGTSSISTGITAAWNAAMAANKTLVGPPRDCTFLISSPIIGRDMDVGHRHLFVAKPRIAAYPGTTMTFVLHPTAALANFPADSLTAAISVYKQGATDADEIYTVAYQAVVSGIKVDLSGIYGAVGFDLGGHQHCIAEDLEVVGTGSAAGFGRLWGPGAINRNIKIIGTRNPLLFRMIRPRTNGDRDSTAGCTIDGLDIVNPEGPILVQGSRSSANIAGMRIVTASNVAPIRCVQNTSTAKQNSLSSNLELFRCSVEYTGSATDAVAIDNTGDRSVSMTQCQFHRIAKIVDNAGTDLAGSASQWHLIREYKYAPPTLNTLTGASVVNGVKGAVSTITHADNGTSATPIANLVESMRVATPNICDETQWMWITEAWNGHPGIVPETLPTVTDVFAANDASARLNTIYTEATAAKLGVYHPSGLWGIAAPLTPPANCKRVWGRGGTSELSVTQAWRDTQATPTYMTIWPDDADAKYQEWYPLLNTGSTMRGSYIGAFHWRGGSNGGNSLLVGGKYDAHANRHYDVAKDLCRFDAHCGGRVIGWVDHARINRETTTGPISFAAGFRQIYVNAAYGPMMFIGFNAELIPGSTTAPWPVGTPTETVVFDNYVNAIIFGSKWESHASAMLTLAGEATDNLYVAGLHSWANTLDGANAPLVKLVSPAAANIGLMLGYHSGYTQSGSLVNATGYATGYGSGNAVAKATEFISTLRQGSVFNPSGVPLTYLEPDLPAVGSRLAAPALDWVQVIWWSRLEGDTSGLARLRLYAPGSASDLATDTAKLTASAVANKNNLLDSDDATAATCVGEGSVLYNLSAAPSQVGQVVLRIATSVANPYRVLVLAKRSDSGRIRTLADLRNPAWVEGVDFVIDAAQAFNEASIWTQASRARARALI